MLLHWGGNIVTFKADDSACAYRVRVSSGRVPLVRFYDNTPEGMLALDRWTYGCDLAGMDYEITPLYDANAHLRELEEFARAVIRYAGNSGDDYLADKARAVLDQPAQTNYPVADHNNTRP